MRDFNVKTSSPDEDRLETVLHFVGETFPRVFVINRLGREVDYVEVDGERYERVGKYVNENDNRTTELLPCPFCGKPIEIFNAPWADGDPGWTYLHVDEMQAVKDKCPLTMACYDTKKELIEAWNTRITNYPESLAQRMIVDDYEYQLFDLRQQLKAATLGSERKDNNER